MILLPSFLLLLTFTHPLHTSVIHLYRIQIFFFFSCMHYYFCLTFLFSARSSVFMTSRDILFRSFVPFIYSCLRSLCRNARSFLLVLHSFCHICILLALSFLCLLLCHGCQPKFPMSYVRTGLHIPVFMTKTFKCRETPGCPVSRVPGLGSLCIHAFQTRIS